ncbi:MAG: 3-oxoacyl-[acyl-carrier-protein] synthase III C-terminal domain-containing protein [Roseiarcus sp.]|jgi:3-oxoacyl-[acyl-carrier-protein] synthase-3
MTNHETIGVTGLGFAAPETVRRNDDPIFDWIRKNNPDYAKLFQGIDERRVLAAGETLDALMLAAAAQALDDAGLASRDIDLLIGLASVSDYVTPNALVKLHSDLGLPAHCQVLPVGTEFTTFNDSLVLADAMIRTGSGIGNVLIACGCNWTRHVSYHEATSIGAADGAGAAIMGSLVDPRRFAFVDVVTETQSKYYGAMWMGGRESGRIDPPPPYSAGLYTTPLMYFGAEAAKSFAEFGETAPVRAVNRLLSRNGVKPGEITLISHQTSSVLIDAWNKAIGPGQYITTLKDYGNMTVASVPFTLAMRRREIAHDHLVLLTLGMQQQTSAVLLRRRAG